jgi:hypothetical protein
MFLWDMWFLYQMMPWRRRNRCCSPLTMESGIGHWKISQRFLRTPLVGVMVQNGGSHLMDYEILFLSLFRSWLKNFVVHLISGLSRCRILWNVLHLSPSRSQVVDVRPYCGGEVFLVFLWDQTRRCDPC